MSVKDFALWSLLAWLWGSSFLAIDIGVEAIAPLPLAAIRMSVGAVALLAVLALRGGNLRLGLRGWLIALVLGGTGNAMPFVLIAYAETQVASGLAALIMGTAPLLTILLAPSVAREGSLTPMILFGGCLGFAGVAVLVGPDALLGGGGDLLPKVALLGAASCYAGTALLTRRFAYPDAMQMAVASVLAGAVVLSALAFLRPAPLAMPPLDASLAALYLGLGPTALAALIYFSLVPRIGARRLQQVNYAVPVIGTVLGVVFLGETLQWSFSLALVLILGGVIVVTRPSPSDAAPAAPEKAV